MPCYNGKVAEFTGNQKCLDNVPFELLQFYGIRLLEEEAVMTTNPGSMTAKYRKPNLRKTKVLKTYQRVLWSISPINEILL